MRKLFHKEEENAMNKIKKNKDRSLETPIELTPEMERELSDNKDNKEEE